MSALSFKTKELLRRLGVAVAPDVDDLDASIVKPAQKPREGRPIWKVLHVFNGDSTADVFRRSGVPGDVTLTADVLHEGPAPAGVNPERWRKVRARYLAESGYGDYDECLARLTLWDRKIEGYAIFDEVILWFEHDLFDQLLLIRLLDWFAGRDRTSRTALSMINIGDFPGIERFSGLGQLSPRQLASLLDRRVAVSDRQKQLARAAWRAFRSPDPTAIERLLAEGSEELPYLAGAFQRHLEEFPSVRNGLSRTEEQILRGLAGGIERSDDLFQAVADMEERVFLGDTCFMRILRDLATGPQALVRTRETLTARLLYGYLTPTGEQVLAGRDDWVHIHGIDRWLGGVHLHGPEAAWRYDPAARRLIRCMQE